MRTQAAAAAAAAAAVDPSCTYTFRRITIAWLEFTSQKGHKTDSMHERPPVRPYSIVRACTESKVIGNEYYCSCFDRKKTNPGHISAFLGGRAAFLGGRAAGTRHAAASVAADDARAE